MQKLHQHFNTRKTPQREAIPNAQTPQVKMRSGGYGWEVDDWTRLNRFLIMGTEGGTYYVGEKKLTRENAQAALRCIKADGSRVVREVVSVSDENRAFKNDQALFVLAMCAKLGDEATKTEAYRALPKVARIGTHLFIFAEYAKAFGGLGGNGFKRAIGRWYNDMDARRLALQVVKYQQRNGWSHRDMLRLSHAKPATDDHMRLFHWATKGWVLEDDGSGDASEMATDVDRDNPFRIVVGHELAKKATKASEVIRIIKDYRLPHECIPTKLKNDPDVMMALLPGMPPHALIRQLGRLTAAGLVTNTSEATKHIVKVLSDQERLVRARVHPMAVLLAMQVYEMGRGVKGKLSWSPAGRVVDALDSAFYLAFKAVEPTGKRLCLALDVSGSMGAAVNGAPNLSCRAAAAAMSLVTANVEPLYEMVAFTRGGAGHVPLRKAQWGWGGQTQSHGIQPISISPRMRLDSVVKEITRSDFGGTDCALPMIWATRQKVEIDCFIIYTDNESWAGEIHVDQALREYRQKMGIDAKFIAVAMSADKYSVANPDDAGQMDLVGFDASVPGVISNFISQ